MFGADLGQIADWWDACMNTVQYVLIICNAMGTRIASFVCNILVSCLRLRAACFVEPIRT